MTRILIPNEEQQLHITDAIMVPAENTEKLTYISRYEQSAMELHTASDRGAWRD